MTDPPPERARSVGRRILSPAIKTLFFLGVLGLVGRSLVDALGRVRWDDVEVGAPALAASVAALVVARVLVAAGAHALLRSRGVEVGFGRTLAALWASGLGRYLPGKVFGIGWAAVLLARSGVRTSLALALLGWNSVLMIATGGIVSAAVVLAPAAGMPSEIRALAGASALLSILLVVRPSWALRPASVVLRRLGREPLETNLLPRAYAAAVVANVFQHVAAGISIWLIGVAIGRGDLEALPAFVGAAALSTVAATVAVFAPAGLGVREGVYLAALGPSLGAEAALIAILARIVQTVVDIGAAAVGMALGRGGGRGDRRSGGAAPTDAAAG